MMQIKKMSVMILALLVMVTGIFAIPIPAAAAKSAMPQADYQGIDISKWQGKIDWESLVKSKEVDFAIVRCAHGTGVIDENWETYTKALEDNKIPYGVYLYSTATTTKELDEEIALICKMVKSHKVDLPIYLDMESATIKNHCTAEEISNLASYFVKKIQKKGYKAGIYASLYWWYKYLNDFAVQDNGAYHWVAQYNDVLEYANEDLVTSSNKSYAKYDARHYYETWQYSSKGSVAGIAGNVDCNYWYGSLGLAGVTSISNTSSGVALKWSKAYCAKKYIIYRKENGGSYKQIAVTTDRSYTDKTAKSGKTYIYKIKFKTKNSLTGCGSTKTITYLHAPSFTKVSNTSKGIKLTWTKIGAAKKYVIYRKKSGEGYSKIASVKAATSYTDTTASNGVSYTYKIKAVNGKAKSQGTTTTFVRVKNTKLTKVKKVSKGAYKAKWKVNSKATGYELAYAKKASFANKKVVKITSKKTLSKTIKKLKSKKTYYFKVRSYRKVDGKKYVSSWSNVIKVKIS